MTATSTRGRRAAEYAEAVQRVLAGESPLHVCNEYRLMRVEKLKQAVYYARRTHGADQAAALKLLRPDPDAASTPIRRCECGKLTAQRPCHHCGQPWRTVA